MSKAFTLVKEQHIPELNGTAQLYAHKRTGARLLSVSNDDENKVFAINFRTPPRDSTGVAHILEHSVLNGSQKFPVKEPFAELLKGSLATFINAFTFPDKTCYPVASQNLQDLYNLIDVYMDAVLHPLISEQTLMQEGWHYELNDPSQPLTYIGVVLNEMKGAYSSPDRWLQIEVAHSLFPKHVYGLQSGGDPRHIPDLTYDGFRSFHATYYHPSNSFIFFYGNDDPAKRLELMEGYLQPYTKIRVTSGIPLRPPFKHAKEVQSAYDAGQDTDITNKHYLTVNWVLPETSDAVMNFSLRILAYILIGSPASPLRKALLESGLGEDLAGAGLDGDLRQLIFSTGLKGTRAHHGKKIERLIFDTLQALVRDGIEPDMVAAAMNTVEFRLRENNTGSFPRGISLMLRALTTWLHDDDPIKMLAFEAPLQAVQARLANDSRYFEGLIETCFLNNPHRTTLHLKPNPQLGCRLDQEEKSRLAGIRQSLTKGQLQEIADDTKRLKQQQETPDSPEALATIPVLTVEDLDKKCRTIPNNVTDLNGAKTLYHDLFTSGIVYLDLGFDLHALPQHLLPLTGVFGRAVLEMGTETEDYVKLSQRIGKSTGGIQSESVAATRFGSRESVIQLLLQGKATVSQSRELLNILRDVLLTARFDSPERFKQIVLEEKAGLESAVVPWGDHFVDQRLQAQFNEAGWAQDQMGGIGYLLALRDLAGELDRDWPSVLGKLEAMRDALVNRQALLCNVTLDRASWLAFKPLLEDFLAALPSKEPTLAPFAVQLTPMREGLTIPAQVNYVGKAANLYDLGYRYDGAADVILPYLRMAYLWATIRVQGGAYGASCAFDNASGYFAYLSYRDPNIGTTLDNYDRAGAFLKTLDSARLSSRELNKAIIAAIGDLDAYQLPDAKGHTSMMRYLTGRTDEMRQKAREETLATDRQDFIAFGEVLERAAHSEAVAVLGSRSAIENANIALKITRVL